MVAKTIRNMSIIKKTKRFCVALLLLGAASSGYAMPMLSPDGSSLSGVNVNGTLYDVTFGDGLAEEVYSGTVFDAEYRALAAAVSIAIVTTLNKLDPVAGVTAISGCESLDLCILNNPEVRTLVGFPSDYLYASFFYGYRIGDDSSPWLNSTGGFLGLTSASNTYREPAHTLVTFRPAALVSTPGPLALTIFGLIILAYSRRSVNTQKSLRWLQSTSLSSSTIRA